MPIVLKFYTRLQIFCSLMGMSNRCDLGHEKAGVKWQVVKGLILVFWIAPQASLLGLTKPSRKVNVLAPQQSSKDFNLI